MIKTNVKKYSKGEVLESASLFNLIDLPGESRTQVMKVVNPVYWSVIDFTLNEYEGKTVTIKFSADVKRVDVAGTLRWQINNKNYPTVGNTVSGARANVWHKFKGEWAGVLTGTPPVIYLSTWRNDSERTTFYIDNVSIEVISD
ncbi:MAG: hypothetical protein FWE74_08125 [Oscillospiraceae bacterium]|nr:hypothetical protein [Oscillospiraceae bacterium]